MSWSKLLGWLGQSTGASWSWSWEHSGGGCYALVGRCDGWALMVSWADDALGANDTPNDVGDHDGYGVALYAVDSDRATDDATDWLTVPNAGAMIVAAGTLARLAVAR